MRLASVESGFSQVQIILTGGIFLTALALSLGAQPWHLGFLAAVPHLTQLFQLIGAYLIEATGRRKLVAVLGAGVSRLLWLCIPLIYLIGNLIYSPTDSSFNIILTTITAIRYGSSILLIIK